jgi:type IV secretory pathway protease TraF
MAGRARIIAGTLSVTAVTLLHFWGSVIGIPPLLLQNTGHSMPLGLYRFDHLAPVAVGEVVVVRNPPNFRHPWLMKRVVGVAGDTYCWRSDFDTHTLNDTLMPAPSALARDIGIPIWRGCKVLEQGEVVGYGKGESYDSRHLGPVKEAELWGAYAPVWVD